ncbi:amidohydrolase [Bacillus sp. E214]|uniref:amidohydrolase n=1 Tax=Bacillus sp. E214 TaxID=2587156 RepID=UPI00292A3BE7|nr:amidohydrolase [Bacillus sp. E214]
MMSYEEQILGWYHHFHEHPEISGKEFETTNTIAEILDSFGVRYERFSDCTGLIAELGEGSGAVALRADIDALWQEVGGIMQANHSCGHDAHIAMALGAILYLREQPLNRKYRFIFQPAEEKGNGSLWMIKRGAMEGVSVLFGMHVRPEDELAYGQFTPSIHHGACIFLEGKIRGTDAHGARPHQGKSAIDVMVAIHGYLATLYADPAENYSIKLTKMIAGGQNTNIIPGNGSFAIDVRAQCNAVLDAMIDSIATGLNRIAELFGVHIDYEWKDYTPGATVSKEPERSARESIIKVAGEEALEEPIITSGSDDFHFYSRKHPDVQTTMIGIGAQVSPGLHHPKMQIQTDILDLGARVLAEAMQLVHIKE